VKNPIRFPNNHAILRSVVWSTTFVLLSLVVVPAKSQNPIQTDPGQLVRVEGEVEVVYEDSHGHGRLFYFLNAGSRKLELRFAHNPPPALRTGMHVGVTGTQVGETLELNSGESVTVASNEQIVSGNPMGQHRVLVVMVNFQDKQTQPFTREQAQAVMFGTTSDFYREASYGQTWLTGDVYGWYTIPVSANTCDTTAIANYAQQAAANAGANLNAYDHIVYAFPQNACTWQGRGSVGGSPSQAWVNEWFELGIVGHELGHNFWRELHRLGVRRHVRPHGRRRPRAFQSVSEGAFGLDQRRHEPADYDRCDEWNLLVGFFRAGNDDFKRPENFEVNGRLHGNENMVLPRASQCVRL
jgi:hypothetical protein